MSRYKKLGEFLCKAYLFLYIIIVFYITFFNFNTANAISPDTLEKLPTAALKCSWKNGSHITCKVDSALLQLSPSGQQANVAARAAGLGDVDYFYDYKSSSAAGHIVFRDSVGGENDGTNMGYLHFTDNILTDGKISTSKSSVTGNLFGGGTIKVGNYENSKKYSSTNPNDPNRNCEYFFKGGTCTNGFDDGNSTVNIPEGFDMGIKAQEKTDKTIQLNATCDRYAGTLSFIFCPLLGSINNAIAGLIGGTGTGSELGGGSNDTTGEKKGFFISLLEVNYNPTGMRAINQAIIPIANAFFIIIFLIIILSTTLSVGLDNYTVKKMLPKLVAGVILVQFSYLIVFSLVDVGNLLGAGMGNLAGQILRSEPIKKEYDRLRQENIAEAKKQGIEIPAKMGERYIDRLQSGIPPDLSLMSSGMQTVTENMATPAMIGIVGFFVVLIIAILALISILIATIAMLIRQFVIVFLFIVAPIAFVLWVLPNTEKFFKMWWENLLKAIMMYPIVTGMISLSLVLAGASSVIFGGAEITPLIAALFPMVALILVPKAFKWSGQLMAATSGAVAARLTGAAKAPAKYGYKKSKEAAGESWKSGKLSETRDRLAKNPVLGRIPGIGGFREIDREKALAKREAARQKRYSENLKDIPVDRLISLNQSYGGKGAQGKAIEIEIGKRYGQAGADLAAAVREGRDTGFAMNTMRNLGPHAKRITGYDENNKPIMSSVNHEQDIRNIIASSQPNKGAQQPVQPRQRQQGGPGAGGILL